MNAFSHGRWVALAAAVCLSGQQAQADTAYVTVRLDKPATQTLARSSFGLGTQYQDQLTKLMFTNATQWYDADQDGIAGAQLSNRPLYDAFVGAKGLNPGVMRFPDGTGALHYNWNYVCSTPNYWSLLKPEGFWMPEEVYKHLRSTAATSVTDASGTRTGMGAELMVQVNTYGAMFGTQQGTDYTGYQPASCGTYVEKNGKLEITYPTGSTYPSVYSTIKQIDPSAPVWDSSHPDLKDGKFQVREDGLAKVAESAGEWVRANRRRIIWEAGAPLKDGAGKVLDGGVRDLSEQVDYWEIGNEDWDSWTAEGYARKFFVIATRMKAVQSQLPAPGNGQAYKPLKLVAQAIPGDWVPDFIKELAKQYDACVSSSTPATKSLCAGLSDVWALSLHPYNNADHDVDFADRTAALFAKVDASSQVLNVRKAISDMRLAYGINAGWEIWATEYNQDENKVYEYWAGQAGRTDKTDEVVTKYYNTKAHGLYLADMTARMLDLGVKKVFPFGTSNSVQWALFNYGNGGSAFWRPRWMPAGVTMRTLFNQFQGDMYPMSVTSPSLSVSTSNFLDGTTRSYTYKSLSAYSSLDAGTGNLRMLLINRNQTQAAKVMLQLAGRQFNTALRWSVQELTGAVDATNYVTDAQIASTYHYRIGDISEVLPVDWLPPALKTLTQTCMGSICTLNQAVSIQPGSMVLVSFPTKLR